MASGHSPPAWAALRMNRKYRPNATPAASPQATPPAAGRRPRPVEGRLSRLTSVTETRHSSAPAQRRDAEPLAVGNAHRDREQRGTQRGQRGHHADRSRGQPGEEHDHSHTADRTSGESHPSLPAATGPPVASAAASMITAPTGALAGRNDSADARRDPTPPRKSAEPYRTAAAKASTADRKRVV